MDEQQIKSIELLKKYLSESSIEDRDVLWTKIERLSIQGPTVEEYFQNLEKELASLEDYFIGRIVIDEVAGISIPNVSELSRIGDIKGNFSEIWSVVGETNYGMAA